MSQKERPPVPAKDTGGLFWKPFVRPVWQVQRKGSNMSNSIDVNRFLQGVFGPDFHTFCILANLNPQFHTRDPAKLDPALACYWSIAAFGPGAKTNHMSGALEVRALVIDDVGTKIPPGAVELALGMPTAIVESSAGNFQWAYRLSKPVALADWPGFFAGIEMMIGHDLDGVDAVHLFRLPMGVNTKKAKAFAVGLKALDAQISFDPSQVVPGSVRKASSGGSGPSPRVKDIRGLMKLVPNNDDHYDDWMGRANQVRALALDESEAEAAFDEWSAKSSKYDPVETAERWATVNPTRTSGLEILRDAEAADPEGFAALMAREAAGAFDDDVEPPPVDMAASLKAQVKFARGSKGEILKTMPNAMAGVTGLGVVCSHDDFHHKIILAGRHAGEFTDHVTVMLRDDLIKTYGKDFGREMVHDAVVTLALRNRFNPVKDMLAAAEALWDGVKRLDRLGPDYFHSPDTELARAFFRKVMLAAVRRARTPGVKFDQILVCESPEGWDKSSAWAVLAGDENFSDTDILGKDAKAVQEELTDIWIHEIADLSGLSKADIDHVKAFASRRNDRARPAYGRNILNQPRQCIEVGTTNADSYLLSITGNRRFWTVKLSAPVDLAGLRRDRLQLWGEAAAAEAGGETLVLDQKLWDAAAEEQEARRVVDPLEDELLLLEEIPAGRGVSNGFERIEVLASGRQYISSPSVMQYLKVFRDHKTLQMNSALGRRLADIMKRQGWERVLTRSPKGMVRGYERTRPNPVTVSVSPSVTKKPFNISPFTDDTDDTDKY